MPADQVDPHRLTAALVAVSDLLDSLGSRGMVIGGIAVSLIAKARYTKDVDALIIGGRDVADQIRLIRSCGFECKAKDPIAFAHQYQIIPCVHSASGVDVDLAIGHLPFEIEAVGRAVRLEFKGISVLVASPEDLIVMKVVAGRPQDLADVRLIAETHLDLHIDQIRRYLSEFAEALDDPEILRRLDQLLGV